MWNACKSAKEVRGGNASRHVQLIVVEEELLLPLKKWETLRKINEVKTKLVNEVSTTKLMKQGLEKHIFRKQLFTHKFEA